MATPSRRDLNPKHHFEATMLPALLFVAVITIAPATDDRSVIMEPVIQALENLTGAKAQPTYSNPQICWDKRDCWATIDGLQVHAGDTDTYVFVEISVSDKVSPAISMIDLCAASLASFGDISTEDARVSFQSLFEKSVQISGSAAGLVGKTYLTAEAFRSCEISWFMR